MHPKSQRGSALVLAIFIMTVMLLIGAAMVQILGRASDSVVYEVQGTRALMAANSALERGLQQLFPLDVSSPVDCTQVTSGHDFSGVDGLLNCQATLNCQQRDLLNTRYYQLVATGNCGSDTFTTSRMMALDAQSLLR